MASLRSVGRPRGAKGRAGAIDDRLELLYPGTAAELCALSFTSPFQLLAATILSAQCTDERVNIVTPVLFTAYPDAAALAAATQADVEEIVRSTGFFRSKASNLRAMAQSVVANHDGDVPREVADLVALPGVGRKTANVVRSVAFDLPGLPVDTHVGRLSRRMGLTSQSDPVKVEDELNTYLEPTRWGAFSLRMILHGRAVCPARRALCEQCPLEDICLRRGVA